ncbi:hypothetical protein GPECTOR_1g749 [Gonium pectorale]|uniref:Fe2OG dioxygenase domain-containing protein n=1 Tax=Gonium pectorale TaxID=33097 RepID=A0A150H5D2_GONPE|nr:hypothetical protein GPECTOR_1g749 [Gonium pectorale]|eukprot:KXZ56830.1 hypothetical protein GPECTOR_1g749 [Gonium pectorale]
MNAVLRGCLQVGAVRVSSQRAGRTLQEKGSEVRLIGGQAAGAVKAAAVTGAALPTINPYDMEAFEAAVSKGLSTLKPPMTPGESGEAFYRTIPFQAGCMAAAGGLMREIISWYPRIMVFPNFIDKARREEIIAVASKQMAKSDLAYRPGENTDANQQVRTSWGAYLGSDATPALKWLEDKVAAVTFLPPGNGEPWNVLNYVETQHYDSHMDSFDPKDFGPQYSQRIATVIVLLSDENLVGGETIFKREGKANANNPITNWTSCDVDGGFKYKPRAGDAVLFWSVLPDGTIDPRSLHGSCPVVTGKKWGAVKWIRSKGEYNP